MREYKVKINYGTSSYEIFVHDGGEVEMIESPVIAKMNQRIDVLNKISEIVNHMREFDIDIFKIEKIK